VTGREFKDAVFQQFAKMAQAFSSPKRLEILDILTQGERDVATLAREAGATVANTSRHLQVLKNARLVEIRKQGVQVFYRLAGPMVHQSWNDLKNLAENRLPEVDEAVRAFFQELDGMEPISLDDLLSRIERDEVVVLDVRPPEEFKSGHIPGAVSIPLRELKARLAEIQPGKEVIAYCRGPYCVLSAEAVSMLRENGREAIRLCESMFDWQERGFEAAVNESV